VIDSSSTSLLAGGFHYENGRLCAAGVPLEGILARVGSAWVYDGARIVERARALAHAFPATDSMACFAVKANSNPAVLSRVATQGLGAEVSSGGELALARAAGFDPAHLVFNGNGKTGAEHEAAVAAGVGLISADSPAELDRLDHAAARHVRVQKVLLRVNPDVDAKTHPHLATGLAESKFGMTPVEALGACSIHRTWRHLAIAGLHVHVGSQIFDLAPLDAALAEALRLVDAARAAGAPLTVLDLGGGFGIDYEGTGAVFPLDGWARHARQAATGRGLRLLVEPGRWVVADAGALLAHVLDVKRAPSRNFVVLDVAMNDLLRPALYDAHHRIVPLAAPDPASAGFVADVVGPVCESGDTLARNRELPLLRPGDGVAVLDAGAYGYSMSSNYNGRLRLPEVLIEQGIARLVRRGEQLADLTRLAVDEVL
jgi:diaminopimelate decarboxylase